MKVTIDAWNKDQEVFDLGSGFTLVKAEKGLFSVYQAIYSDADVEMWYDWGRRLSDASWSDNSFFLTRDGEKIGGAIVEKGTMMYPFLITPYSDRREFFSIMKKVLQAWVEADSRVTVSASLPCDSDLLMSLGFRPGVMRRVMVRPTDTFEVEWPEGYTTRTPSLDDAHAIGVMFVDAFTGGIQWEYFGTLNLEDCIADVRRGLSIYIDSGSIEQSTVVFGPDGDVAGACSVGIDLGRPNRFSGIYDVAVSPKHRGKGLATSMIRHALNVANKQNSPVMMLCVTVGNAAEDLYMKLGFLPGPKFTDMRLS